MTTLTTSEYLSQEEREALLPHRFAEVSPSNPRTSCGENKSIDDATPQEWNALRRQVGGSHYKDSKIQPVEFISANNLGFLEGNAVKYICRHTTKGGEQDIDKAIHYLQMIKELVYNV